MQFGKFRQFGDEKINYWKAEDVVHEVLCGNQATFDCESPLVH